MPSVSIILPTYNSVDIIQPTIDSVLSQNFTDFELLIVDDGSTDNTAEYCLTIEDERVKVHAFPNAGVGGPSASRNRGLALADSEFIAFINHDDLWSPNKLEEQLQALKDNPDAMVAYSWLDHVDMDGEFVHVGSRIDVNGHILHDLLRGNFIETGSNPLIRAVAFDAVGVFNSTFRLVADWEMWLRIAMDYQFVCIPKVHVYFRDTPNALSTNTRRMERDALKLFTHIYGLLPRANEFRAETYGNFYEYLASRTLKGDPTLDKASEGISFLRQGMRYDPQLVWRKRRRVVAIAAKAAAYKKLPPKHIERGMQVYRHRYA